MAPVNFATVCFRFHPGSLEGTEEEIEARLEELNSRIMAEANATGEVFLSHTKLKDQYTLRLVFGHLRTTGDDVREVWELLTRLAEKAAG